MNNGMLGFPGGGNQGEITGSKKWWSYVNGNASVPGMPARGYGIWYFNDTGEELEVAIQVTGAATGVEAYVADMPVAASTLLYNSLMPLATAQQVHCLGLSYGPATTHLISTFKVPVGSWYYLRANGSPTNMNWNEYRRKP